MLTSKEIRDKLFELPAIFNKFYEAKNWPRAKHAYDTAITVTVFIQLSEADQIKLFGSRAFTDADPPIGGMFDAIKVSKAYQECIKANQTYNTKPYPGIPADRYRNAK